MAVRYPIVILSAYAVFLLLLRLWILIHRTVGIDFDAIPMDLPRIGSSETLSPASNGTADFAGAGAGGQWTESQAYSASKTSFDSTYTGRSEVDLDVAGGVDLDDLIWIILALIAILAALLAIFYVIYIAPVLLAEIFIDGAIVAGLYRTVGRADSGYWLSTAVRKTVIPALLTAALFGAAGFFLNMAVPEAGTVGQAWAALFR